MQAAKHTRGAGRAPTHARSAPGQHPCLGRRTTVLVTAQAPAPAVVITGASSGIGKATALLLARQGWQVFAGIRKDTDGVSLVQLHSSSQPTQPGGSLTPVVIDVLKPDTIQQAATKVEAALRKSGTGGRRARLRGLINNAGKCTLAPLEYMPVEVFEDHLQVNLVGALRVTQAFLPLMRHEQTQPPTDASSDEPSGRIVNISSQSGTLAYPLFGGYACSKFGLEAFSDVLRYELQGQNIQVVCFQPGPIKTDIWSRGTQASAQVLERLPPEGETLYGKVIKRMSQLTRSAEENGGSVDDIAALIQDALTTDKPRARYMFGKSAAAQMIVRKFLPDRIWDKLVLSIVNKV